MASAVSDVAGIFTGDRKKERPMTASPESHVDQELSPSQREMVRVLEQHQKAELVDRDIDITMATMTEDPHHIETPVHAAVGGEAVRSFYAEVFMRQLPADLEITPISRTVGANRIVDEGVATFTHSIQMDWLLPGVPPTNRRLESPTVFIIEFREGKLAGERIYWDQAYLLRQVGALDLTEAPGVGAGITRTLLDLARRG